MFPFHVSAVFLPFEHRVIGAHCSFAWCSFWAAVHHFRGITEPQRRNTVAANHLQYEAQFV